MNGLIRSITQQRPDRRRFYNKHFLFYEDVKSPFLRPLIAPVEWHELTHEIFVLYNNCYCSNFPSKFIFAQKVEQKYLKVLFKWMKSHRAERIRHFMNHLNPEMLRTEIIQFCFIIFHWIVIENDAHQLYVSGITLITTFGCSTLSWRHWLWANIFNSNWIVIVTHPHRYIDSQNAL